MMPRRLAANQRGTASWSHTDPHFNLVFGEMLARFQQYIRTGCAVMFSISQSQRLDLERKQIRVVELPSTGDRNAQLAEWLINFSHNCFRTERLRSNFKIGKINAAHPIMDGRCSHDFSIMLLMHKVMGPNPFHFITGSCVGITNSRIESSSMILS